MHPISIVTVSMNRSYHVTQSAKHLKSINGFSELKLLHFCRQWVKS